MPKSSKDTKSLFINEPRESVAPTAISDRKKKTRKEWDRVLTQEANAVARHQQHKASSRFLPNR